MSTASPRIIGEKLGTGGDDRRAIRLGQAEANATSWAEFLALPPTVQVAEWVGGKVVPKRGAIAGKRVHSGLQKALLFLLDPWARDRGHLYPEWAVALQRQEERWGPVPDVSFVSFARLATDWIEDDACPVPPDLAIEIISPGQSFSELTAKALDYLAAGVARVWLVDAPSRSIAVFAPNTLPVIYRSPDTIVDAALSGLAFLVAELFAAAGLSLGSGE